MSDNEDIIKMMGSKLAFADESTAEGKQLHAVSDGIRKMVSDVIGKMSDPKLVRIPAINALMCQMQDFAATGTIKMGISPSVGATRFLIIDKQPVVMLPPDWTERLGENPTLQMGGLAYAASHARDYYNKRDDSKADREFGSKDERGAPVTRALAHESEFFHWVAKNDPKFKPNKYQAKVMAEFPDGVRSIPPEIAYEPEPFWPE
jgi:hypothetical protein